SLELLFGREDEPGVDRSAVGSVQVESPAAGSGELKAIVVDLARAPSWPGSHLRRKGRDNAARPRTLDKPAVLCHDGQVWDVHPEFGLSTGFQVVKPSPQTPHPFSGYLTRCREPDAAATRRRSLDHPVVSALPHGAPSLPPAT